MRSGLKLAKFLKPYWRWVALAPLLMLLEVAMDLMQPRMIQRIVDEGIARLNMPLVIQTGLLMMALALIGVLGGMSNGVCAVRAVQAFGADLRESLFRVVQTLSFGNLDDLETGQLITRLTNDATQVQDAIQMMLRILVRAPLLLVGSLVMAIVTSPQLAFLPLVLMPVELLVVVWIVNKATPMYTLVQERLDTLNEVMEENLAGVRVVKAFARTQHEQTRFGAANDDLMERGVHVARTVALTQPFMMLSMNLGVAGVAQRAVRNLRGDLFAKLQTLSLRFFDQRSHGELMSRLTNDVENINNVLTSSATQLLASVLGLIGVVAMMLALDVPLALVCLVVMPLTYVLTRFVAQHMRQGFREQQQTLGALNGIIEETITGQRVVKAYVREQTAIEEFRGVNRRLQRAATRAQTLAECMGPSMNMVNNLGLAIVAGSGGWLAIQGLASVGTIATFVNYSGRLSRPLNQIAQLFNSIQSALAGAERIFELLDEEPEIDAPDARPLEHIAGNVVFDDVCFGYEAGVPVLKNVGLHAEPGQMIALVGPTGAGKTTIANLLTRFYDVDGGAICVDGQDVRAVKKDDLRRKLGLVLQDNFLFADTVMANIRYGRLDATDEEVIAAARLANADSFIHRLPQGYQTVLTERGNNLSQGQRQLLAIARAVLADPDILILDEATSNVDTRTEKHLQEALLRLMGGRTSFVIAHRLSTIRDADQVMVVNGGEIIERGTHASLLAAGGFYHRLYMSQFKGQAPPEGVWGRQSGVAPRGR